MSAEHVADGLAGHAGTTIMIVDDEVLVRGMISDELRAEGHTVLEAANADEALAILRSRVRVDIVVTDMDMPGSIDGCELVRMIRRQWPDLRVMMVSGKAPDEPIHRLLDGYLPKPFTCSKLVECVRVLTPAANETLAIQP